MLGTSWLGRAKRGSRARRRARHRARPRPRRRPVLDSAHVGQRERREQRRRVRGVLARAQLRHGRHAADAVRRWQRRQRERLQQLRAVRGGHAAGLGRRDGVRASWKRWDQELPGVLVCFLIGRIGVTPTQLAELDDEGNISPAVSPSVASSPVVGDKTHVRASVRSPTAVLRCGPLGVEGMITHPVRCCSVPPTLCRELSTPPVHGAQQMDVHPVRRVRHVVSAPHTPRSVPRLPWSSSLFVPWKCQALTDPFGSEMQARASKAHSLPRCLTASLSRSLPHRRAASPPRTSRAPRSGSRPTRSSSPAARSASTTRPSTTSRRRRLERL